MSDGINETNEFIQKDPKLPNSLEEARQRGFEIFHESPGEIPHRDQNICGLRVKQKVRKYLECTPTSDNTPCGETLPFRSPQYSGLVKKIYVCTGGNCSVNGYIAPANEI